MPQSFQLNPDVEIPKDLPTGWITSLIKVGTQVGPTTGSVAKLASPLAPSNQAEEERWQVLVVTASVRRLNLEANRVTLKDMLLPQSEEWPSRILKWWWFSQDPLEVGR